MLALAEVRDAAVRSRTPAEVEKFVQELGWRDYYVRIHAAIGDGVWDDLEPYKTGEIASAYAAELPDDIAFGTTGAACVDGFVRELDETGYLHNHARMWFASYVVHWRRVRWQAGAAFFLRRLLDGDAASNNLSWQWVASTFAHKPYIFNRENLERYTRGTFCARCPLADSGCPFEASYDRLDARLFPHGKRAIDGVIERDLTVPADPPERVPQIPGRLVVWQHDESLAPIDAARTLAPRAPAIYVHDALARQRDPWSPARDAFVAEGLAELGLAEIASGDAAREILRFARAHEAAAVLVTAPIEPRLRAVVAELEPHVPVLLVDAPRFATLDRSVDLRRHARYWSRAKRTAFGRAEQLDLGIVSP
jgi:deoxyribodipyrimidine photo-lyase